MQTSATRPAGWAATSSRSAACLVGQVAASKGSATRPAGRVATRNQSAARLVGQASASKDSATRPAGRVVTSKGSATRPAGRVATSNVKHTLFVFTKNGFETYVNLQCCIEHFLFGGNVNCNKM